MPWRLLTERQAAGQWPISMRVVQAKQFHCLSKLLQGSNAFLEARIPKQSALAKTSCRLREVTRRVRSVRDDYEFGWSSVIVAARR